MRQSELSERETNGRAAQRVADKALNGSMSVDEWCAHRRVSRAMFYKMVKDGTAPATYYVGSRRFVSDKADAAWLSEREVEAAA